MWIVGATKARLGAALAALVLVAGGLALAPGSSGAVTTAGVVNVTATLAYQQGAAAGTGMVLTSSGQVLTNNHVIRGATSIRVTDPSTGRTYPASVVGYSVSGD